MVIILFVSILYITMFTLKTGVRLDKNPKKWYPFEELNFIWGEEIMNKKPIFLTKEGFEEIKEELNYLINVFKN